MDHAIAARLELIHDDLRELINGIALMVPCMTNQADQIDALTARLGDLLSMQELDRSLDSTMEKLSANQVALKRVADNIARLLGEVTRNPSPAERGVAEQ